MKTDLPLKRLIALCSADLLPLLGTPDDIILEADTKNLPSSEFAIDTVLHMRTPDNQTYFHILEWQAYIDRFILWRLVLYMALLARQHPGTTILGTVIYLYPRR